MGTGYRISDRFGWAGGGPDPPRTNQRINKWIAVPIYTEFVSKLACCRSIYILCLQGFHHEKKLY